MNNKIESMVLGAVVGDTLGVPVEFITRKELIINPVIDLREFGTHNQPIGTWSDDTSLTLALIDVIVNENGWNIWNFAINASEWMNKAKYTANDKVFDIGIGTSVALNKFSNFDIHPSKCGGSEIKDNGNGSLMRIHPLLVVFINGELDLNERFLLIKDSSSLTHNHDISHISCFLYLQFLYYLINNEKKIAYKKALIDLEKLFNNNDLNVYYNSFNRLRNDISLLEEDKIFSSGYVLHTLEASIWSFLNTNDYKEAVLKAVNLGDDTDTTGTVTGAIAGLYYNIDSIPNEWLNKIIKLDYIKEFANKLSKIIS